MKLNCMILRCEDPSFYWAASIKSVYSTKPRVESLDTGKRLVHLIDREGDSIGHMRTLSAQG
ncbi:hypothetical protein EXD76_01545, partial [BEV proteobacterium]|nr:hypothetical protein [Candidatus Symbiopectobacterium sp. Chty_BC]